MICGRCRASPTSGILPVPRSTIAPSTCAPATTRATGRIDLGPSGPGDDDEQGDAIGHAERTEMARRVGRNAVLFSQDQRR